MHVGVQWTTESTCLWIGEKKPPTLDTDRKLKINGLVTWRQEERETISSQTLKPILKL